MNESAQRKARLIRALAGESIPVLITGTCMAPLLNEGARVKVRHSPWYLPGDILVYSNAHGDLIAHRLLGYYRWKSEWRLLIKADNAPQPDGGIPAALILGKVLDNRPGLARRLQSAAQFTAHGFLMVAARWGRK